MPEHINELELMDWKRRISDLYLVVRNADQDPDLIWKMWRGVRDDLFKNHPQSPIPDEDRGAFQALPYFDYDPDYRVSATLTAADDERIEIGTSGEAPYNFRRVAFADFALHDERHRLSVFWLEAYGGGMFVSFRDRTSGSETYGAGRYLLDTVKGADLGMDGDRLTLDFNFAYNPSCSYDPRWVCPLAPPENHLSVPIRAGERLPS